MNESRGVVPVLSALAEAPCSGSLRLPAQGDSLVHLTKYYARQYLQAMKQTGDTFNSKEARLKTRGKPARADEILPPVAINPA
jgi:hypothetical protein